MSGDSDRRGGEGRTSEGWEALASEEPSEGTLAPSAELEEALREAAEAVSSREPQRHPKASGGGAVLAVPREEHERVLAELEEVKKELAETRERVLRLQADFDNHRKRTLKEREEAHRYGHERLVRDLLGSLDDLERAIQHTRSGEGSDLQSLLEGVELVQRGLLGALTAHAVKRIDALGQPFDPNVHEAMAQQESNEVPPGTVLQVFQDGYQLHDRLLRPARVVVSRKPEGGSTEEPAEENAKA